MKVSVYRGGNLVLFLFLVVVFTGLPHPPHEENMAQQFIQDITVLSGNISSSAGDVASVRNSGMSVITGCLHGVTVLNQNNLFVQQYNS